MPATLDLSLDRAPAAYRPGDRLDGHARWDNATGIRAATVRLVLDHLRQRHHRNPRGRRTPARQPRPAR